jgi:AhpD family alkylhydroperoxidase
MEGFMTEQNFPKYRQHLNLLMKRMAKELAGPSSGFAQLRRDSLADGALNRKVKELLALGIAIAARCDACIAYHVHDSLRAGATRKEIVETIGVAMMMGGGPATMYGCHAFEALEQFETERAEAVAEKLASQNVD